MTEVNVMFIFCFIYTQKLLMFLALNVLPVNEWRVFKILDKLCPTATGLCLLIATDTAV